jgi:hypothetical protein
VIKTPILTISLSYFSSFQIEGTTLWLNTYAGEDVDRRIRVLLCRRTKDLSALGFGATHFDSTKSYRYGVNNRATSGYAASVSIIVSGELVAGVTTLGNGVASLVEASAFLSNLVGGKQDASRLPVNDH